MNKKNLISLLILLFPFSMIAQNTQLWFQYYNTFAINSKLSLKSDVGWRYLGDPEQRKRY